MKVSLVLQHWDLFAHGMLVTLQLTAIAVIVGFLSPGKTFLEPPVGALLAVLPTLAYLDSIADVYELPKLAYVVGGLLGVLATLMGAFVGERLQPASTRKRAKSA